jgi:magnesium transporter
MVDRYYPVAESLANRLDDLEQDLFEGQDADVLPVLRRVRGQIVVLRRIAWPQREMVNALLREQSPFVSPAVQGYLRDTHDHIAQIVELVDSSRDLAATISDEFLSAVGQRTNEIMKVLTLMASVFIPLTFVAGIYGMNFENMPELRTRSGYFLVLGFMAVVATIMLTYFRRRGWIGRRRRGGR